MSETAGATKQLCSWIHNLSLEDIPDEVKTRAKYLILDGICCALVGAHLPWTEKAANALFTIEPPGDCVVWGYNKVNNTWASDNKPWIDSKLKS